jgi:hypothetical protein
VIKQRSQSIIVTSMLGMLVTAAVGCAANIPDTRDARAAGYWQARLPTTPSTFGKLAYGTGGSSEPARVSEPASQPLMATATAAVRKHKHVQSPVLATPAPTAVAAKTVSDPLPVAKTTPAEPPVMVATNTAPDAERRYGQREAETKKLQEFRGGDAVVITGGALLVVLLIVILVLLLR